MNIEARFRPKIEKELNDEDRNFLLDVLEQTIGAIKEAKPDKEYEEPNPNDRSIHFSSEKEENSEARLFITMLHNLNKIKSTLEEKNFISPESILIILNPLRKSNNRNDEAIARLEKIAESLR